MQLPRKMSAQNVVASISSRLGNRESKPAGNEIRFAGDERKDKLYEPKHKQKLVRVFTVVAYVIFVSMAAILLSLYYTFLWDPKDVSIKIRPKSECTSMKLSSSIVSPPFRNETQMQNVTNKSEIMMENQQIPLSRNITIEQQRNILTALREIARTPSAVMLNKNATTYLMPNSYQEESNQQIVETLNTTQHKEN